MASNTTATGTPLFPSPTPVPVSPRHGMRLFWQAIVLVVALTAALGTWVITQSDNDTIVDSSTSTVTGPLSPNAADYRDAQTLQQQSGISSQPLSPRAADHRDAQLLRQLSGVSTQGMSPGAADYRDAQIQQQSSSTTGERMSPNAADYGDRQR